MLMKPRRFPTIRELSHECQTIEDSGPAGRESLGEIPRSRSLPRRSQGTLGMRPFSSRCGEQLLKLFKHASRALQCLRNRCRLEWARCCGLLLQLEHDGVAGEQFNCRSEERRVG